MSYARLWHIRAGYIGSITSYEGPDDVSDEEWSRYQYYQFPRYGIWEYMYLARKEDMLSDIQWLALDPYSESWRARLVDCAFGKTTRLFGQIHS